MCLYLQQYGALHEYIKRARICSNMHGRLVLFLCGRYRYFCVAVIDIILMQRLEVLAPMLPLGHHDWSVFVVAFSGSPGCV